MHDVTRGNGYLTRDLSPSSGNAHNAHVTCLLYRATVKPRQGTVDIPRVYVYNNVHILC